MKTLFAAAFLVALQSGVTAQDDAGQTTAAPTVDAALKKQLLDAAAKIATADNFTFTVEGEEEGGFGGGPQASIAGTYAKGQPVKLAVDEHTFYRDVGAVIHKAGEKWEMFDFDSMFSGGGGGDRDSMMRMLQVRGALMPHQVLKNFEAKFTSVERKEKDGKVHLMGDLSEKGADELSGAKTMRDMMSRFGGGEPDMKVSGKFDIALNAEGVIVSIVVNTSMAVDFGGQQMDRERVSMLEVSKIGETELKVPKEVLEAIEF